MALNFPASPANGATHDDTSNGIRYIYNSTKNHNSVIAYYNFNPKNFEETKWGFKKTERFRAQFLIESVSQLRIDLLKLNISLIIDHDYNYSLLNELIKKRKILNTIFQIS